MKILTALVVSGIALAGCSGNPAQPAGSGASANLVSTNQLNAKPGYDHAYYNGTVVTFNEIQVPQNQGPLEHASAELYSVVYPPNKSLWPSTPPQCNPCDHNGNGDDPPDYHDHVFDSIPSDPGHGEFSPIWQVIAIVPVPSKIVDYAKRLPLKSEADIDKAIADGLATEIPTGFYFICAVVSPNAAK